MVSRLRTSPTKGDSVSDRLSRLVAALAKVVPSPIRRSITPERSDSPAALNAKHQRATTEGILDLYATKADKDYVDEKRDLLSYEKLFPQPAAQWDVVVPNSTGLRIHSSLVLSSLSGDQEAIGHHLVPDETASDARCSIYFNETVSGLVRLKVG